MPTKTKVVVTKSKLDTLADTIATKAVITLPETIDNLTTAVASIRLYEEPNLQNKSVNPAQVSQTVTADSGYDGLGTVTVGPLPYDLSQDTVNPAVLLEGYTAHDSTGTPIVGTYSGDSAVISVTEELDENGGIIKHINAIDISHDTVDAAHLLQGYTAHDRQGNAITGTYTDSVVPTSQTKTVTPTKATQVVTPDSGVDYLSQVTVNPIPNNYIIPSGTKNITANGTSDVTSYASVSVNVSPSLQTKTVAPTESSQTVTADNNYDGLRSVTVSGISKTYVGSEVPTQSDTTITPTKSAQEAVAAGTYVTGDITVAAIPSQYIIPSGSKTISANGTGIDVTSYATVNVNVPTSGGGITPTGTISITTNGTHDVTNYASAEVNVPGVDIPTFTVTWDSGFYNILSITCDKTYNECASNITNATVIETDGSTDSSLMALCSGEGASTLTYTAMMGFMPSYDIVYHQDGTLSAVNPSSKYEVLNVITNGTYYSSGGVISEVNVNVPQPSGSVSITTNGTHDVTNYASASVNVQPALETTTVIPTESQQVLTPSSGNDGFSQVTVNAISPTYVGSEVSRRSSSDLTASGATITAPAGYYAEAATKSVASGSATTPATTITANPSISVSSTGLITATASASKSVTPTVSAGYVSSGTSGTITVSGSNTSQLTTQAAKTITPSETAQTAVAVGRYTTGAVTVAAISSTYVGSGIDRRDETDLTASGATVTVPAGYYAEQGIKSVTTATHPDPTVSVSSSGLITASHTQGTGYVTGGTTTKTQQLTTKAATTITPTKSSQTAVASGVYTTGAITVAAIPAQYITTTDATASAADIVSGETAYVNGSKVTGSLMIQHYYTGSSAPSSSTGVNGDIYLQA